MKDTDRLSRRNTVTYGDVRACEGMTVKEAAAHLNFDYDSFRWHVRSKKLSHLFEMSHNTNYFMPKYRLTLEMALSYNEMTIKDAANACNVNVSGFTTKARIFGITSLFAASKRGHSRVPLARKEVISKRNKLAGPELIKTTVNCSSSGCSGTVKVKHMPEDRAPRGMRCSSCKNY